MNYYAFVEVNAIVLTVISSEFNTNVLKIYAKN